MKLCDVCKARPEFEWTDATGAKHTRPCDPCHIVWMLRHPDFAHTTYVERCLRESILFYRREPTSPSGVLLIGGVEATKENLAVLHGLGEREIPGPTRGDFARL